MARRANLSGQYKRSVAEYAKEYDCTDRTIKRWRQKGYPLDNPEEMKPIILAQKSRPAGVDAAIDAALDSDEDERYDEPTGTLSQQAATLNDAKLKKVLLECDRIAHQNAVRRGEYSRNEDIRSQIFTLVQEAVMEFRRVFENELPPKCEGLNAAEIQLANREALDGVLGRLSSGALQIGATTAQVEEG